MESAFTKVVSSSKRMYAVLIIFGAMLLLMRVMSPPSVAQSEERVLKDEIPKHLPIKVKIKKEKEQGFKRVDNERWLRDFELEVTNIGEKPIYYLRLVLRLPEFADPDGSTLVFPVDYGRTELSDIQTRAKPEDVPIKQGETYVFKIHSGQVPAWEKIVREGTRPQPKIIQLWFQKLSFGDATGYAGKEGVELPRPLNKQKSHSHRLDQINRAGPKVTQCLASKGDQRTTSSITNLPARFLPVNFLSSGFSRKVSFEAEPLPQNCCPGFECSYSCRA